MRFEHEVQEETFDKRRRSTCGELFDEPYHDPETDHFYVRYGTTVLEISVEPYGPEEAVVTVMSYCVQDVEVERGAAARAARAQPPAASSARSRWSATTSSSPTRSSAAPRARATCCGAITAVATLADDYDDRIVAKYGGQTALERIQDTGGRRRRTETGAETGTEVEA